MITRKQIKIATKLISPEAGKVLATYRTKSRGHKTANRPDKPIERTKQRVKIAPCYSGAAPVFRIVTLARVDFIKRTDKYFTGESNG